MGREAFGIYDRHGDMREQAQCLIKLALSLYYDEGRLEEAKSEALRAMDISEKLRATRDLEECRKHLQSDIQMKLGSLAIPG